jgi:hypothetical protein
LAQLQLGNARRVDVKAQHGPVFAKFHGKWQAHVTQANDGYGFVLQVHA